MDKVARGTGGHPFTLGNIMAYDHETLSAVWFKAKAVPGYDGNKWRKDQCGAWILWSDYGKRSSDYGWEVDHIKPQSNGGGDNLSNLRPLHWQNNLSKSNGRLSCAITANGNKNVET